MAVKRSGAMFATAPISRPVRGAAFSHHLICGGYAARDEVIGHRDEVGEGVLFCRSLPSSYQVRPISPPPRTCAIAKIMSRSIRTDGRRRSTGPCWSHKSRIRREASG